MKDCKQLTKKSNKSSNVESGTRKWCSYHHSNDRLNEDCHQQQSESENINRKEIWYTYQDSGCRSDGECYYKRKRKRSSPAGSKSAKDETFVADSNETGCDKCSCNRKVENKCTEIDDQPNNTTPGIGFSFAMCHPPLSEEAIGFQLKVDSGSSKHFINPELIRGAESRMLDYTRIEPAMEMTVVGDNLLRATAEGVLLVAVRRTYDVLRTAKLPTGLVPGLKRNLLSSSAKRSKKIVIERNGSSLDLGAFSIQFTQ